MARGRLTASAASRDMENQQPKMEMPAEALSEVDFLNLLDSWVDPPMVYENITPLEADDGQSGNP